MIKRLRNALRQLRWKLTLSYTAVAVGTLLIMLLILGFLVFSTVLIPGDVLTPDIWITATNDQLVPIFHGLLAASPPDLAQIKAILEGVDRLGGIITGNDLLQIGQVELTVQATADIDLAIVGPDGSLFGTSNRAMVPAVAYGQPFDPDEVPGLGGPLTAALAGETDPERLFSVVEPDEEYIWAVPVFGTGEASGEVLGALIVKISSVPTRADLTAHALTLVARSALFFAVGAGLIGGLFGSLTAEGMVSRFGRLWRATEAWSRGDFSRFVHDRSGDEISQLAGRLNTMAVQLKELLEKRQQLAVTEERNRLARDLHDSAKQQALAASFQLGTAITLIETDPQTAKRHLLEAEELVDSVRLELTDLIAELRPPTERRDLTDLVTECVREWTHQNSIKADLTVDVGVSLPLDVEQTVYRILQEALANVARHSRATSAAVDLSHDSAVLTLTITDNGVGFDPDGPHPGIGLHSMRERAESIGGRLAIQSQPGPGTMVTVTFPLTD
jgi:NarL family two-component system sensor histidine kinase LiaS